MQRRGRTIEPWLAIGHGLAFVILTAQRLTVGSVRGVVEDATHVLTAVGPASDILLHAKIRTPGAWLADVVGVRIETVCTLGTLSARASFAFDRTKDALANGAPVA